MNDCIGIGRILGHKFEARYTEEHTRFAPENPPPTLHELSDFLEDRDDQARAMAELVALHESHQGRVDNKRHVHDVCVRCGKISPPPALPPPPPPPPAPVVQQIQPGLVATVKVGPMRP